MMSGFQPAPPTSPHSSDVISGARGSGLSAAEEVTDAEAGQSLDGAWSQDGGSGESGRLDRRWLLWHQFMQEHAHLDSWLRLVEEAASRLDSAHVTYVTAKEELGKFERLRGEAASQLVQLDSLTRRNRTLTQLFEGAMQARLLALARACGQRWDEANAKLKSITSRLKLVVSEWEAFEAEMEELAVWLADLDVRLTAVDHLTGNNCEKLRRLQSFQESVCVNSACVNALLWRGEALIQRSPPTDAQHVERRLLELMQHCNLVYNNIGRTHTRLLSLKLVFEDDTFLSLGPDSGCPSENLLEDEGSVFGPEAFSSPVHDPPPPPCLCLPTHEHLGLEWDPSVDFGRSVSRDDADSSYFSVSTGVCHRDGVKRRSYISCVSDLSHDEQEVDSRLDECLGHAHPGACPAAAAQWGGTGRDGDQWMTSTLTSDRREREPITFDRGRVRAWLGVQSPAPTEGRTTCSRAVQTDEKRHTNTAGSHLCHDDTPPISTALVPSPGPDRRRRRSRLQAEEDESCADEAERLWVERRSGASSSSSSLLSPPFLCFLLAAALALLAVVMWVVLEPPCRRSGGTPHGLHLMLRYINGPPPT